jgi:hypothetical protein
MLVALNLLQKTEEKEQDSIRNYEIKDTTCEHKITAIKQKNSWSWCAKEAYWAMKAGMRSY